MNLQCSFCSNLYPENDSIPLNLICIEDFIIFFKFAHSPWKEVGPFKWACNKCVNRIKNSDPIKIMPDGRCNCKSTDICPLNKIGSTSRCLGTELYNAGCKIAK